MGRRLELFLLPLGPMVAGLYAAGALDTGLLDMLTSMTCLLVLMTLERIQVKLVSKQQHTIPCRHSTQVKEIQKDAFTLQMCVQRKQALRFFVFCFP